MHRTNPKIVAVPPLPSLCPPPPASPQHYSKNVPTLSCFHFCPVECKHFKHRDLGQFCTLLYSHFRKLIIAP